MLGPLFVLRCVSSVSHPLNTLDMDDKVAHLSFRLELLTFYTPWLPADLQLLCKRATCFVPLLLVLDLYRSLKQTPCSTSELSVPVSLLLSIMVQGRKHCRTRDCLRDEIVADLFSDNLSDVPDDREPG
jgi:hypothetical protein